MWLPFWLPFCFWLPFWLPFWVSFLAAVLAGFLAAFLTAFLAVLLAAVADLKLHAQGFGDAYQSVCCFPPDRALCTDVVKHLFGGGPAAAPEEFLEDSGAPKMIETQNMWAACW